MSSATIQQKHQIITSSLRHNTIPFLFNTMTLHCSNPLANIVISKKNALSKACIGLYLLHLFCIYQPSTKDLCKPPISPKLSLILVSWSLCIIPSRLFPRLWFPLQFKKKKKVEGRINTSSLCLLFKLPPASVLPLLHVCW